MSSQWLVIGISLAAAFMFASSTVLKHASASSTPNAQSLELSKVGAFLRATVSHRLWICAIVLDVLALLLQITALHLGALSVVQPLMVSGLLFALILRKMFGQQMVSRAQIGWAIVLTAALGGFLVLAAAGAPSTPDAGADRLPAVLAGAVGLLYAATAALLKALTTIGAHSPQSLLVSWQLYTVIAVGAVGLFLNQLALQAGRLSASLPATGTVDPLMSIVIGVAVFDEHINRGIGSGTALLARLVVMGAAIIQLARTPRAGQPTGPSEDRSNRPLERELVGANPVSRSL